MSELKSSCKNEILRLQGLIKRLETELHECCLGVLAIGDMADVTQGDGSAQALSIDVIHACTMLHLKYDYRVSGYDYEDIIINNAQL